MKIIRMATWLLLGLTFYVLAYFTPEGYAQLQTVLYKAGHVTTSSYVGFWVACHAFPDSVDPIVPPQHIARAVLMAAIVIGWCTGL